METVFAAFFLALAVSGMTALSRMLETRILLEHACHRAARAKSVGFNGFMCLKTARAAMIPVSGKRLWPQRDFGAFEEAARIPTYLASPDTSAARGVLDYEYWGSTSLDIDGSSSIGGRIRAKMKCAADDFTVSGAGEVESHFPLYMDDCGR